MAFLKSTISSPNDFITQLSAFAASAGWSVLAEADDLPIAGGSVANGKRLVLCSPSATTFVNLRSANGAKIFPTQNTGVYYGVGITGSTAFTESPASGLWYDQTGATKNASGEFVGAGIPLHAATECNVYFNHVSDPAQMIIASVEVFAGCFQHIAFGELQKIGTWTGGAIYSASHNSSGMFASSMTQAVVESTSCQLFGANIYSNTFLRVNIDAAPLRSPEVLWASSGPATGLGYTGKRLGLPIVHRSSLSDATLPKIPHYGYLQSQSASDYGRNVNTLNCISVNLPIAVYVLRDPDGLANYSQCGYVPGVYCISTRNVAPGSVYSVDYPSSGINYQAFPQTSRGGVTGYDGISIKQ